MTVAERKAAMRAEALARRAACDPADGRQVAACLLGKLALPPSLTIAGVWPLPGEMDLRPLLHAMHARGDCVVLPETTPRGQALRFRTWHPGSTMVEERFGTLRPDGELAVPSLILVPLLAFDLRGARLGYGGGYYDRTLAGLPGVAAVGFGFAAQEVPEVPVEAHDRLLDAIVTEREFIRAPGSSPARHSLFR